jgi:hypothetical protein
MRIAALALLVVFASCKRSRPDVETRLKDALTAGVPGIVIERGEEGVLVVKRGTETVMELTLDPIARTCAKSPEECESVISNTVTVVKKSAAVAGTDEKRPPADRSLIRLTPKPAEWLTAADEMTKRKPEKAADNRIERQPFVGELSWVYVIDQPEGMEVVNHEQLTALGFDQKALHAQAVKNLETELPVLELTELGPGVWTLPGGYLDSARLALTEQWRDEAKARGGTLFMAVPARGRVFVVNDAKLLPMLSKLVDKAFAEEDHPLTRQRFKWAGEGWALVE